MYPAYRAPAAAKVGGTGTSIDIFPQSNNSALAAAILIPSGAELEGQQFIVRAGGRLFVHGTSPTVNIALQNGTSLTSGSNSTIATLTSAQALTTGATYPWAFEALLQGDSTSGIVQVLNAVFSVDGNRSQASSFTLSNLTGINFGSGYQPS